MAKFRFVSDFQIFNDFVKRKGRYHLDATNKSFLEAVLETAQNRVTVRKKKSILWRAQEGHDWRVKAIFGGHKLWVEGPYKPKRMKPLPDRANEGRINPKGIPYLYLSTDKNTAMSEARPCIYVTVADFVVLRDLRLVNCSSETECPVGDKPQQWAWSNINSAFSKPVCRSDDVANYVPTQVLAEAFRNEGYDGIVYGTNFGKGENVALFDVNAAKLIKCYLYEVAALNFRFSLVLKSKQ